MTGTGALNLHGNHLHVSAFEVLTKDVLGRAGLAFQTIVEVGVARGLGAQPSAGMLFSKITVIVFQTHCCG